MFWIGGNYIDISKKELLIDILPNISEENIDFDVRHWKKSQSERKIPIELIYDCLMLKYRPKVTQTKPRRFKLCYNFPKKVRNSGVIIVIEISKLSKKNITVKTTYERNVKQMSNC